MDPNKKQHWFLLAFMVPQPGAWAPVAVYAGLPSKAVSAPILAAAREANKVPNGAVLLSFSYCGYLTGHQMRGTSATPVPTKMTDAYKAGMMAYMHADPADPPKNPYSFAEGMPDQALHVAEWADGFNFQRELSELQG